MKQMQINKFIEVLLDKNISDNELNAIKGALIYCNDDPQNLNDKELDMEELVISADALQNGFETLAEFVMKKYDEGV